MFKVHQIITTAFFLIVSTVALPLNQQHMTKPTQQTYSGYSKPTNEHTALPTQPFFYPSIIKTTPQRHGPPMGTKNEAALAQSKNLSQ